MPPGSVTLFNKTISPIASPWFVAVVIVQIGEPLVVAIVEAARGVNSY